ncbi:MAG TPA: VIT1/CCC1 family protein [Thermoanaerobaculia bacterium]
MPPPDSARYLANLRKEIDGVAVYTTLSENEKDPKIAEVFRRLAAAEQRHADVWARKLRDAGKPVPPLSPSARTRMLLWLARRFGARTVLHTVVAGELRDMRDYAAQPEAKASGITADERSHARLLKAISAVSGVEGGDVARLEGRHKMAGGNALRAAVLGANDGLVSNLSLVMGVAGAELSGRTLLITGLAGLLAGSISMALGEWLSVQSSREYYEHEIETEREEIEELPEEEMEELALIYEARGIAPDTARGMARDVFQSKPAALETLAREEIGIDPAELGGSAWIAAGASFLFFAFGAAVPVLPYLWIEGAAAVWASLAASAVGLFLLGAGITLFTSRPVIFSGLRQVAFGLAAAAITFGIGRAIGVSIGG